MLEKRAPGIHLTYCPNAVRAGARSCAPTDEPARAKPCGIPLREEVSLMLSQQDVCGSARQEAQQEYSERLVAHGTTQLWQAPDGRG